MKIGYIKKDRQERHNWRSIMSFKPELSTDGGKTFHANDLAFATREEAELSAQDIYGRWMLATDWRAVESDQPVNYQIVDGVMSAVGVAVAA